MDSEKRYRYPGVGPFAEEESSVFFGRVEEVAALSKMLMRHDQVLLYGKSGAGKSSMIRAGLLPLWRPRREIVEVRFSANLAGEKSPAEILLSTLPTIDADSQLGGAFPNEDGLWLRLKSMQLDQPGSSLKVLFVFDQFEELFAFASQQIEELISQIQEAFSDGIPFRYRDRVHEYWANLPPSQQDRLIESVGVKMLVSIREDKLGKILELQGSLPDLRQNDVLLRAMNRDQAREAIVSPGLVSGEFCTPIFSYDEQAVEAILDRLGFNNQPIEPTLLQVVCQQLERQIGVGGRGHWVGVEDVPQVQDLLRDYYQKVIDGLPENARSQARTFIEDELIHDGWRIPVAEQKCLAQMDFSVLVYLSGMHLIRSEYNSVGGKSYELSHDVLVEPLVECKLERMALKAEADFLMKLSNERGERQRAQRSLLKVCFLLAFAFLSMVAAIFAGIYANNQHSRNLIQERRRYSEDSIRQIETDRYVRMHEDVIRSQLWRLERERQERIRESVARLISQARSVKFYGEVERGIGYLRQAFNLDTSRVDLVDTILKWKREIRQFP